MVWLLVIAFAVWGAVSVCLGQWQRFNDNPTVVTLEKDFRSWRFSLPAITSCVQNKTNPEKVSQLIMTYWNIDVGDPRYNYYSRFVETVANSDLFHLEGFQDFQDDETVEVDLFKLAVEIMPSQQVKATWSDGFNPKWTPVMTEAGACYVTNSLASHDAAIIKPNLNDTSTFPLTCKFSSLSCYVILESTYKANFYVHSPYDMAEITVPPSRSFPTLNRVTELSVTETGCGKGVRELSPRRRGCLYTDEPVDSRAQVYSTNSCRRSCRNRLAIQLCGCKPFYNFYEEGVPCSASGMACLSSYSHRLANLGGEKCPCSAQCIEAVFRELSKVDQIWERGPLINRGAVKFIVQAPRTRYTREIVFHFQDLIVSFGGAAGLFLGASFISFVETLYFVIDRMVQAFSGNTNRKASQVNIKISHENRCIQELTAILDQQSKY